MPTLLEGKIALVTGGGGGIGRATAGIFAREGAKVVVADVLEDGGAETARMIEDAGGEASFVRCDVTDPASVEALVKRVVEIYGRLDCAFNNAGIEGVPYLRVADNEVENFDRVIGVNLKGVFLCMKYELPVMLEQGGGAIVNTGSSAGISGVPGLAIYSASKGGVLQMTKAAAVEYARTGIRINAVCPGGVDTPMVARLAGQAIPSFREMLPPHLSRGQIGAPSEIGEAVAWLASDQASFVTGHCMSVDGGLTAQ